jgi:hypothetical protein
LIYGLLQTPHIDGKCNVVFTGKVSARDKMSRFASAHPNRADAFPVNPDDPFRVNFLSKLCCLQHPVVYCGAVPYAVGNNKL